MLKLSDCRIQDSGVLALCRGCGQLNELEIRNSAGTIIENVRQPYSLRGGGMGSSSQLVGPGYPELKAGRG